MRTILLFDDVDATSSQTSDVIKFEQRAGWLLQITKSGTDGTPRIVVEYSIDNAQNVWTPLEDCKNSVFFFGIDDSPFGIMDDRLPAKFFRIRLEANDNTTGTLTADLGYKTYP